MDSKGCAFGGGSRGAKPPLAFLGQPSPAAGVFPFNVKMLLMQILGHRRLAVEKVRCDIGLQRFLPAGCGQPVRRLGGCFDARQGLIFAHWRRKDAKYITLIDDNELLTLNRHFHAAVTCQRDFVTRSNGRRNQSATRRSSAWANRDDTAAIDRRTDSMGKHDTTCRDLTDQTPPQQQNVVSQRPELEICRMRTRVTHGFLRTEMLLASA